MSASPKPIAVVGAGAAGLLAAVTAARRGLPVVLLERTADGGRKILISGGGRCNILPSRPRPDRFVTDSSPNTLRKILTSWDFADQRTFFEDVLAMPLVLEPETGKLFPASNRARDVRDGLLDAARAAGAKVWLGTSVLGLEPRADGWHVALDGAPPLVAAAVVVATGGLSVPKTGSDGTGLSIVRALGHELRPTYPALTPLTVDPHPFADLAGVSARVTISEPGGKRAFRTTDALLVTHRGWSGPAVLDASHLAVRASLTGRSQALLVQWTDLDASACESALLGASGSVRSVMGGRLPRRLLDALARSTGVEPDTPVARLRRDDRRALVHALTGYSLPWTGDEGYKKAEVTGGGVALAEVNPRTMESRRSPGLYLVGEILDAFGPIGGHNFHWAWTTGWLAGMAVGGP